MITGKEVSLKELSSAFFERIDKVDDKTCAFVTVSKDYAFKRIDVLSKERSENPLYGIPLAVKDNICTKGIKTTCSSKILEDFIPPYESTVTEKLLNAGYVLLGKTNLDEFAMGSSTESSAFRITKNPWSPDRTPGGSSGGSAAAVAADECIAALGSDTGGSIRQPASYCGVVGLKPTYGRVSRYGLVAFASSLDQIGPITKNVRDSALLLQVISGHDKRDSTSALESLPDFTGSLTGDIKGVKFGIPEEYFTEGIDSEVKECVKNAVKKIESLGAEIVEINLPHTEYAVATYYILATSEASSNLARYDGVKYGLRVSGKELSDMYLNTRARGFGTEVKRRIMLGTYALSSGYYDAYYKKAQQARTLFIKDFKEAFKKVDIIITPTTPDTAFKIGEKTEDPLLMYLNDICTLSVNLAGVPAISIPCGFDSAGMPVGLQIIGNYFAEDRILNAAYAYEQSVEWSKRRPAI